MQDFLRSSCDESVLSLVDALLQARQLASEREANVSLRRDPASSRGLHEREPRRDAAGSVDFPASASEPLSSKAKVKVRVNVKLNRRR